VEFIKISAGANVPPVIDDTYPYLQGTFLITADGNVSLINHERGFNNAQIDYWKDYSELKKRMSFTIDMFHFLIDSPESFSIALPFFNKHLNDKSKPIYSESSFEGRRYELSILRSLRVLDDSDYQAKRFQLDKDWEQSR
jgi:hypothetical protein